MANPESNSPSNISGTLTPELRKQLRAEIDGEPITTAERFALEQKYGIVEPVLLKEEIDEAGVTDGR
jgi:hypothetical protein